MPAVYRAILKWMRTLHIYLTMFGLLLVLFFATTGFVLNHSEWFSHYTTPQTRKTEVALPMAILSEPDKLAVVERLRSEFGATGAVDSFEIEEDNLRVVFKSPGRQTEATIRRDDGTGEVTHESRGILGRLTDLHKGNGSGPAWGLVIDSACILLLLICGSGLFLLLSLRRRRWRGLGVLALGLALCLGVYAAFVP